MRKRLAAVTAITAAAGLAIAPAAAAFAAQPLPEGDAMYSAGYHEGDADEMGSSLFWRVVPGSPSVLEPIGEAHAEPQSITDGAYSASTGRSYMVGWGYGPECELWSVDVATGDYTLIAPITQTHVVDEDPVFARDCNAFEILDDGTAYVTIFESVLFTLDLTTGAATFVADIVGGNGPFNPSTISTDIESGVSYAIDWNGNYGTLDLGTGAFALIDNFPEFFNTYDSDFDSAGALWVTNWPDSSRLMRVADPADPAVNEPDLEIEGWATDSIWIAPAPAPALAATGVGPAPLAVGAAAVMLLLGTALVLRRGRARAA
jgi:hypothetical protein